MTNKDMRECYRLVFNSEDGAKILKDLEYRFHVHGSTFSDSSNETAYREGQRTVVLFLQHMLKENPKLEDMIDE